MLKSQIGSMNAAIEKRFEEIKRRSDGTAESNKEYVDRAQKKMNDLWSDVKSCILMSDKSYGVFEEVLKSSPNCGAMSVDGRSFSIEMPKFLLWEHGNAVMNVREKLKKGFYVVVEILFCCLSTKLGICSRKENSI